MKVWCRGLRVMPWLLLAWLASCGGGTTQIRTVPAEPNHLRWRRDGRTDPRWLDASGINGLNADNVFDCALLPIWSQQLASQLWVRDRLLQCSRVARGDTRRAQCRGRRSRRPDLCAQIAATGVTVEGSVTS